MTVLTGNRILLVCDDKVVRVFSQNQYVEALEEAALLDFELNSPEMNDGIQGNHVIRLQ
jgi:hypothetical protein